VAGWCNTADVVAQAVHAKNLGCRIMIDFHYSDTWADPRHQYNPAAWATLPQWLRGHCQSWPPIQTTLLPGQPLLLMNL